MADNVQPDAGEQREESSSGLLLSVDPLQGTNNYKLSGDDDSDSGKGGLLGDDASDSDGSDSDLLGGDDDSSDASDADGSDSKSGDADGSDSLLGGDSDASDASDADTADAGSIIPDADSGETDEKMNPLGIADTNVDGPDSDGTDAK
jgi:hypothetical protein